MRKRGQCSETFDFVKITKPTAIIAAVVVLACASDLAQVPTASPTPPTSAIATLGSQIDQTRAMSLQDAMDRASKQVSAHTNANLNSRIAEQDVRQSRAAFFPKITAPLSFIYTTPSLLEPLPHLPSYISADAITVFQALVAAE